MARRAREPVDIAEMMRGLATNIDAQALKPNILAYVPLAKQKMFHESRDYLRMYIGGNRSGKSYGSVAEDIWWASKTHPFRTLPEGPIRGRVVAVDIERGVNEILLPIFKTLIAPSMLVDGKWESSYKEGAHKLFFRNGSTIEFMSYEQSVEKFAGTSRHWIHYDEEPPKEIFNENQARLVDTAGSSWISMTPVEGATWLFDDIYEPALEAEDKIMLLDGTYYIAPVWRTPSKNITVIEIDTNENTHLDADAQKRYFDSLTPEERAARKRGTFVTIGGKVFKNFQIATHVNTNEIVPGKLQREGWQIYTSVDHGWNNPTAWLWHAVSPQGQVVTFAEHYESEMTIEEHALVVHGKEAEWKLDTENIIRTGDPAMHQHSGITGTTIIQEYAKHGLYVYTESVPTDRGIGIARMQQYFRVREETGVPTWTIHESCQRFISELRKLKWAQRRAKSSRDNYNKEETVHKKDDHAFDSAKYFATFLDDLTPDGNNVPEQRTPSQPGAILRYDEALHLSLKGSQAKSADSMWTTLESFS